MVATLFIATIGCRRSVPKPSTKLYTDYVAAFYTGLAALQVGDDVRAERELANTAKLVPAEPAGWANWGILRLRQRDFDAAQERLERARKLDAQNDRLYYLLGLVATGKGQASPAIADFRKAVELNPKNLIATYQLAEEIERQGDPDSDGEFEKLMQQIVQAEPGNVAALLELGRVAAKRGDAATLKQAVAAILRQSQSWPPEVQQQFTALQAAASGADPRSAALRTTFLRNVLMRLPDFRRNLAQIKPQPGDEAQPFIHFLTMETPTFTPAPADTAMTFNPEPVPDSNNSRWTTKPTWIGAISLGDEGAPTVVQANGSQVSLATGAKFPFPGGPNAVSPSPEGIIPIDFNYDFKTDLVLAGAGGVRFLQQENPQSFTDVTAKAKLPPAILNGRYTGGWAVDIEADGDLDIVLGSTSGIPIVLRNNGDSTFTIISPFRNISGVRQFVWADLNGEGNPDATFIDGAGHLRVFTNQRSGKFTELAVPASIGDVKAVTAADASHNGILDLLVVQPNGVIQRIAENPDATGWQVTEIARATNASALLTGEVRLHAADLDNNGAIDLLLGSVAAPTQNQPSGGLFWLGDEKETFLPQTNIANAAEIFDAADVKGDGRLALLGFATNGGTIQAINRGTKGYRWQVIRPRAKQAVGDQRINSFGIGGEIEIRSGLLTQMQAITSPQVHFGLGAQDHTDVARILWPNGTLRAEFALKADQ